MLAVISPAKSLDYRRALPPLEPSAPRFGTEAGRLAAAAAKLSKRRLGELMHISDSLARLNADRFRTFGEQPGRPALYAFAGDVYMGFEVDSLDSEAVEFAQHHVRILSGLYGLLRPLDSIRPYRLEMGTRWAPGRAKDLYGFWNGRIAEALAADLEEAGSPVVVNLASREYWRAVGGPPSGRSARDRDRLPRGGTRGSALQYLRRQARPRDDGALCLRAPARRPRGPQGLRQRRLCLRCAQFRYRALAILAIVTI
jgi:cytoplasmic iron level regulating protein YaaA (DUF328/UPF0246 family)